MKVSTACLCLLLTDAVLIKQMHAHPASVSIPDSCCYTMVKKKIPFNKLQNYTTVNNRLCPQEAVIFKTKLDKDFCADPTKKWVQNAMKYLDQKSTKSRSSKSSHLN